MGSPDRVDGVEVEKHQARLVGTIDLDPTDVNRMTLDTVGMAVVVYRVSAPNFSESADGVMSRINKCKLREFAIVRDQKLQQMLFDALPALLAPESDAELPFGETIEVDDTDQPANADGEIIVAGPEPERVYDESEIFKPGERQQAPAAAPEPRSVKAALSAFMDAPV